METMANDLKPLIDNLVEMHYVMGYHLPISPTNYEIDIVRDHKDVSSVTMISEYNVTAKDGCCFALCCLYPKCKRRKQVTDHFLVHSDDWTMELKSTSALGKCFSKIEAGKKFAVIRVIEPYLIMVQLEPVLLPEVFILAPSNIKISKDNQNRINVEICRVSGYILALTYM